MTPTSTGSWRPCATCTIAAWPTKSCEPSTCGSADVDRLRDLDRLKDEFLATVSHELRTPLTSIAGMTEMLLGEEDRFSAEETRYLLGRIDANVNDMTAMVERILDYSRLQAGRVVVRAEVLDLAVVVSDLVDKMQATLQRHVVELAVPSLLVRADADALANVLRNLLQNAAKYSPPVSRVEVGARADGDDVVAWVRDEGIGIAVEDRSKIFRHFYQAGDRHRWRRHRPQHRPPIRAAQPRTAVAREHAGRGVDVLLLAAVFGFGRVVRRSVNRERSRGLWTTDCAASSSEPVRGPRRRGRVGFTACDHRGVAIATVPARPVDTPRFPPRALMVGAGVLLLLLVVVVGLELQSMRGPVSVDAAASSEIAQHRVTGGYVAAQGSGRRSSWGTRSPSWSGWPRSRCGRWFDETGAA